MAQGPRTPRQLSDEELLALFNDDAADLSLLTPGEHTRLLTLTEHDEPAAAPPDAAGIARRVTRGFAQTVLPSTEWRDYIEGPTYAARHPIESAKLLSGAVVGAHRDTAARAREGGRAAMAGDPLAIPEALGYAAAAALPLIGPAAAAVGEQLVGGDRAEALGSAAGLVAPFAARAVAGRVRPVADRIGQRVAATADRMSQERLVKVMAPELGPNKVRLGNQAAKVVPALAREPGLGAVTRTGFQEKLHARLDQAGTALDAAEDARNAAVIFPTKPILTALSERRARLTAQTARAGRLKAGKDVVPAPHASQVAVIDQAAKEIRALGPYAHYEALRRVRAAYDGPAKARYAPSVTADFLAKKGESLGAADVTGVLRDALAGMDSQTAAANATYSLYRSASDVLDATEEIQRVRPTVGRKLMARGVGAMIGGGVTGEMGGMAIGAVLAPVIDEALNAGVTTRIASARLLANLADAVRAQSPRRVAAMMATLRHASVATGRLRTSVSLPASRSPLPQAAEELTLAHDEPAQRESQR